MPSSVHETSAKPPGSEDAAGRPDRTRSLARPMGRAGRLALVASLYSTQNLCLAAYNYTFLIAAQKAGVSLQLIGAAAGIAMILVLKFLWAPLLDRFGSRRFGHYRGWLLLCQSLLALGALGLAALDPGRHFVLIMAVFAVLFVFAGSQDVAADATTTRLLPPADRGIGNGIQSAGGSFAQVMGGGLLLFVSGSLGWGAAMVTLAVLSALPLPLVLRWSEHETTAHLDAPHLPKRALASFFTRPGVLRWAFALMPLYLAGGTVSYNLVRPLLTAAGWSEARLGVVVVIAGGLAGIVSGVAAGLVVSRLDARKSLLVLGLVQAGASLATIGLTLDPQSVPLAVAVVIASNAGFAAIGAVVYTISMDLTRIGSSGSDFTLFTTLSGIIMVIAGGLGIGLSGSLGFTAVSVGAAVLAAVGLALTLALAAPVLEEAQASRRRLSLAASDAAVEAP